MTSLTTFEEFLSAFFALFNQKSFRGKTFLAYLQHPGSEQSNDEASIVDMAIASPLLSLLGFEAGDQVYNQQHLGERPDFAPRDTVYGTCFIVEDKNTASTLSFDLSDANSHLAQLRGYMKGVHLGLLFNGKQLTAWQFNNPNYPQCLINLDIIAAIEEWNQAGIDSLSSQYKKALEDLFFLFRREAFTSLYRLEKDLALDELEWQQQALLLGNGGDNEARLVESLQALVKELQNNARRLLASHLTRFNEYQAKIRLITDNSQESANQEIQRLRERVLNSLSQVQTLISLQENEYTMILDLFSQLEQDARIYSSPKEVFKQILAILNGAFVRRHANNKKASKPPASLETGYENFAIELVPYVEKVFAWHQRQAKLRQDYQADIRVHDDYLVWSAIVQETMLGGLEEEQKQGEFALQAAYVVFIRLLLIRVCEDKGVFPNRFVSDGGVKNWQSNIERYWIFATGNPYSPLLDMAYNNAQNIYAHFFTGRELFNWFVLDRLQLVMTLHQLSRFNFAGVDSDIVGTVYSTYVNRKEKKEKGQYYTPSEIVNYILDEVGYQKGAAIIGDKKRLIDPACGSGSFLVAAAKRLVETYKGNAKEVEDPVSVLNKVRDNLYGFDLNPFACYLAEVNLLIQVLDLVKLAHDRGSHPTIQRFNIYNVDALARPTGAYRSLMFNTLIAEESDLVDQIKSRSPNTPYENGFAFVVANPPYGAKFSDEYKAILRQDYADVFYGQPDSYVFFFKLGLELLATGGKLGFITPNTYLMGKHTANLRKALLQSGRIEQIVDLPQGIWSDATVDCVLFFLKQEFSEDKRISQKTYINVLGFRDQLSLLLQKDWQEVIIQNQNEWINHTDYEIDIRYDSLIKNIENACKILSNGNGSNSPKFQQLGSITESSRGIEPYHTKEESRVGNYVKYTTELSEDESHWKPLLDGQGFVGRYELRISQSKPYLNYGNWLYCPYEPKYFDSPKIILVRLRNKSLKRRIVATFEDQGLYIRDNYSSIIQSNLSYQLKYILALINSSVLNFWYSRKFDNVNINPKQFRQLPIFPADAQTQGKLVEKVDQILAKNAQLNQFREQGYTIRKQRNGNNLIEIPGDRLLTEIQETNPQFSTLTLFDAKAVGFFSIPDRCDLQVNISSTIYGPDRYPQSIVLRNHKLWLVVENEDIRRYLLNYLKLPQWQGRTWDDIKNIALIPAENADLEIFFQAEQQRRQEIQTLLAEVARIDAEIDQEVLDLYGINEESDRQRILNSTLVREEETESSENIELEERED